LMGQLSFASASADSNSKSKTVQEYLNEAKVHLASARFNEALDAYDAAIGKGAPHTHLWVGVWLLSRSCFRLGSIVVMV
jgi:hypothetical protein